MKKFIGSEVFRNWLLIAAAVWVIVMLLSSCGDTGGALLLKQIPGPQGDIGMPGGNCSVSTTVFGASITCPDGTSSDVYNGTDGVSCLVETVEGGANIICGLNIVFISDGATGQPGSDGSSCSALENEGNKFVICTDGTSFQVLDGINGQNALIETVDLCGNSYRLGEVLLRFSDDQLYGVYAKGQKIHMTIVKDGDYVSTDGFSCYFHVINGQIFY